MSDEREDMSEDEGIPTPESPIPAPSEEEKQTNKSALTPFKGDPLSVDILNTLNIIARNISETNTSVNRLAGRNAAGSEEERDRWMSSIGLGVKHNLNLEDEPIDPFNRPGNEFTNNMHHQGMKMTAGVPRYDTAGKTLTEDHARMAARAAIGLGLVKAWPMFGTGVWLKIKTPHERELVQNEQYIAMQKIDLGRNTSGMSFSTTSVYMNAAVTDLALRHVYEGTLQDISVDNLKKTLLLTDMIPLHAALAAAMYPDGYTLTQPCVSDPYKCTHIDVEHINVNELIYHDYSALNNYQLNHMADRDAISTKEQLETYRDNHSLPHRKVVKINDNVSIVLEVPTIHEYEVSGYRWVNTIEKNAKEVFGKELSESERNDYISRQGAITQLREYAHFIKAFEFADGSIIKDTLAVEETLDDYSTVKEIRNLILKEIRAFIKGCIVTAVGIPKYPCSACSGVVKEERLLPNFKEIIPLEVTEIFFTLRRIKLGNLLTSD